MKLYNQTMKAAVFYGKGDLRIEQAPIPVPGVGELLLRVLYCGVCGTDVAVYQGNAGCSELSLPVILGHEIVGEVVALGAGVSTHAVGQTVSVDPSLPCGQCPPCQRGQRNLCRHMRSIGMSRSGGYAEYVCVPAANAYVLPQGTPAEEAAMAEPLACALHAVGQMAVRPGARVLVLGGGMAGMLLLSLCKMQGAALLALSEPSEEKRRTARALGADLCFDPTAMTEEDLEVACRPHDFTHVFECIGRPATMAAAPRLCGQGGRVMLYGMAPATATIALCPYELFCKEISIHTSYLSAYEQTDALALLGAGRLSLSRWIGEVIPLSALDAVLQDPARRGGGKILVDPRK